MLIPFLWMVLTSLKTSDQVQKQTWLPARNYVEFRDEQVPVEKMVEDAANPGLYHVKFITGDGNLTGSTQTISTNELTQSQLSKKIFSYTVKNEDGEEVTYDVKRLQIVEPKYYYIEITNPHTPGEVIKLHLPETEIISKIAFEPGNYPRAIERAGVFGRAYLNSIIVAIIVTVGQVFTSSLAAYAFARLKFPGRDVLFMGYLATMMIPGAVTMIPVFVILKAMPDLLNALFATEFFSSSFYIQFGSSLSQFYAGRLIGLDSYFAIIAPGLFSAYGTFMLRQFFMSIPVDLEDAAKIDGCSLFRVYTTIILPLSKPALATLTIFTLLGSWRNFLWPMVVTSSRSMQTLPVMLSTFGTMAQTQWELLMAASMMALAPIIVAFFVGQRFFIEGIQLGGVKG